MTINPKDPAVGQVIPPLPAGYLPHPYALDNSNPNDRFLPRKKIDRPAHYEKDVKLYDLAGVEIDIVLEDSIATKSLPAWRMPP